MIGQLILLVNTNPLTQIAFLAILVALLVLTLYSAHKMNKGSNLWGLLTSFSVITLVVMVFGGLVYNPKKPPMKLNQAKDVISKSFKPMTRKEIKKDKEQSKSKSVKEVDKPFTMDGVKKQLDSILK